MIKHFNMKGFTMLEIAVILVVVALIAGGAIGLVSSNEKSAKARLTRDRMEYIMENLEMFALENNFLPCPADPDNNMRVDNEGGFSDVDGNNTCDGAIQLEDFVSATPVNAAMGGVPYQVLSLTPQIALDGWNRKIMYVVDTNYVDPVMGTEEALIQVVNGGGTVVTNPMTDEDDPKDDFDDHAVVLLLSYGANGAGAYKLNGSKNGDPGSGPEMENAEANDDNRFMQAIHHISAGDEFDDIVVYKTTWQFIDNDGVPTLGGTFSAP